MAETTETIGAVPLIAAVVVGTETTTGTVTEASAVPVVVGTETTTGTVTEPGAEGVWVARTAEVLEMVQEQSVIVRVVAWRR